MPGTQKWIVGIDVRPRSDGAVRFGAWLHAQTGGTAELLGVHVAESQPLVEHGQLASDTREQLRLTAERAVERVGARAAFAAIEVVEAEHPVRALETAHEVEGAYGLIVGRRAAGAGEALIRLGSVARRLLRRLVAPTFIVPPDVEAGRLGDGPIVVALTPTAASAGAVAVAHSLATATGRPLVFVHAAQISEEHAASDRPPAARAEATAAGTLTRAWLEERGLVGRLVVRGGEALTAVLSTAASEAAPFLVCGSRQLSAVERIFGLSLSSDLAAQAAIPVLVVPPDAGG